MSKRLLKVALYMLAVAVTGIVAVLAGSWYGRHHVVSQALAEQFEYLDQHLQGIEIGDPFPPSFVLWETDGVTSHYVEDLYPIDFIFFLGSRECGTCHVAVDTLWQLICTVERRPRVILVVDDPPAFLLNPLQNKGVDIPLYWDMRRSLRADYGVPEGVLGNRIYFRLDSNGMVLTYGRLPNGFNELSNILRLN